MLKWIRKFKNTFTGLTDAIDRFPLTSVFLLAAAIVNAYDISTEKDMSKYLITFIVGAFLGVVAQTAFERYFRTLTARFLLIGMAILLTAGYYLIILPVPELSMEIGIRTSVALFALFIAFIWVPVIKSKISFNKSFVIAFKSIFNSLFFSGIIYGGISIILTIINLLIFPINVRAYPHSANIIFAIFAPMYFLSLIPRYPGAKDKNKNPEKITLQKESINKAARCPKFLEILISSIIIPLITVYTLILVIYIIKNIRGEFWTNNLLEPMLISYAITGILVYLLASEIDNKSTRLFKKIFPKVLVPIVLFQIAASIISLSAAGITHTRYYVILFGIFAALAGILLSFLPVRKNGIIAPILIVFAVVSIVPPVDAFTISRTSQTDLLKNVLVKNNMLENNQIKPNSAISDEDKKIITNTVHYLTMMEYTKGIKWLPDNVNGDFSKTFGFKEYQDQENQNPAVYLSLEPVPINIHGFDAFVQTNIDMYGKNKDEKFSDMKINGKKYTLLKVFENKQNILKLVDENNQELIRFHTQEIFDRFDNYYSAKSQLPVKEATFSTENHLAKMNIVVQNAAIEKANTQNNNAQLFVFVQVK